MPKLVIGSKGFTLIELMVVIAIISVLAVMGFATFRGLTPRGNDAKRRADIDAINKAFEANYNATSFTPYGAPSASWFGSGSIPRDPDGSIYYWNGVQDEAIPANTGYVICARLTNPTGNSSDQGTSASPYTFTGASGNGQFYCRRSQQ